MQKKFLDNFVDCSICGRPVCTYSGGRPRVYHPECKKLSQLLSWVEDLLIGINFTDEKSRALRSRFWYLANQLNGKKQ